MTLLHIPLPGTQEMKKKANEIMIKKRHQTPRPDQSTDTSTQTYQGAT
jgi:hypothetical protein